MSDPAELRVRMVAMLSGLTRETTFFANQEYTLPRATAERYYDHGLADIIDPAWTARPRLGNDEQQRAGGIVAEPETLTPGPSPVVTGEGSDAAADASKPARSRAKKETP